MEAQIRVGAQRDFKLKHAVLIYSDGSAAFATLHDVVAQQKGAPYLGQGSR
jgi:hypothetical protein